MLRGKNQFTSQRLAIICLLEVSFPFATILLKHCGSFTVEKNWGFSQACTSSVDIFGKRNAEHCSQCCPSDLCNVNCKYHIFLTANLGVFFFSNIITIVISCIVSKSQFILLNSQRLFS